MGKSKYYDGTKLLSMTDINGNRPEVYISDGTRTGGKTTYFNRMAVNRVLKDNQKFMLLFRYIVELDNVAANFWKDISQLFFQGHEMHDKKRAKGKYLELFLDDRPCGYAVALNSANFIKKNSHLFTDTDFMLFDEFQPETNAYLTDEILKLKSIHTSVARGQGEMVRYVPLYMISNSVTLLNPYYVAMGISTRLREDTKFLKGVGFVMEHMYNPEAAKAQKESLFNQAFGQDKYLDYAAENVYLNDSNTFVENVKGKSRYVGTIRCNGKIFGIREYQALGFLYCSKSYDLSYPLKLSVTTVDHDINFIMQENYRDLIMRWRMYFMMGAWRFEDLLCKEAVIMMLGYR